MVIGITGGVGCGKSTVLRILQERYNAHIIDADKTAHRLMEPGETVYKEIVDCFGKAILGEDGSIDRGVLGQLVFSAGGNIQRLNTIVHPEVKRAIIREIDEIKKKAPEKIIAVEAALFIEAGYMDICDELWYIYTDSESRLSRLMRDRGYSEEKARGIMAKQLSDEEFRSACEFVIDNGGSIEKTRQQIKERLKGYGR